MRSNRRKFLKTSAVSVASFQIVPRYVIGGQGHTPPSETYGAALIGCGGRGPGTYEPMVLKLIFCILALFINVISYAAQKTDENFREKESRPIRGQTTTKQAKELEEEGVPFSKLPWSSREDA